MLLDMDTDVTLFEEDRLPAFHEHRVAKTRLQLAPARGQGRGDVAHVLVVHAQNGAQTVAPHGITRARQPIFAHPLPVDALLPVHADHSEGRHARNPFSIKLHRW